MPDLQPTDDQVVTMIVHRTLFFTPDPSHSPPPDFDSHLWLESNLYTVFCIFYIDILFDLTLQTNHRIMIIEV